ncbi:hypothetical protein CkaCkLH20_08703 [Colletotrichum karsti]|uniref:MOSC domain-containing protein n=1 Tax=Colletotrichum karsti TaxID=1095194 RepID=A0A9P6I0S7_9PEZI|nr:uncharacterized protein CkaCkLH20_08703 [Colletotrichum karsti]KAF9873969.1 hypothetical protein CkaCkLH20_08703 [Colletotrichum karsti]
MGDQLSSWFSERLGFETRLAYIGHGSRPVLGSMAPHSKIGLRKARLLKRLQSFVPFLSFPEERLVFNDIAHYLVVTEESNNHLSSRLEGGCTMDVTKFRPNIVVKGASGPFVEDFWGELTFDGGIQMPLTANCYRCQSITVDFDTGKTATDDRGMAWKKLNKDRRVDKGAKYSPVFGRYGYCFGSSVGKSLRVGERATPWSLAGKTAIITGGSRGIGRGIAIHFARKGASNIAITYVANKTAAEETLKACRELGAQRTCMIQADMVEHGVGQRVINEALSGLDTKTIDILVNNAILGNSDKVKSVVDTTPEDFNEMMHANVFAPVALTVAFLPHAPAYGGRVINISSIAAKQGNRDPIMTYGASKAALESFTRSFADQYSAEKGMTFNSVGVGPTATDALERAKGSFPSDFLMKQIQDSICGRVGEPEDIAYIVGFLASEEGRWVNGAAVSANGGHRSVLAAFG